MTERDISQETLERLFPQGSRPFFNAAPAGLAIANRYVAWVDLMGAKSIMGRSLWKAANFIGKIHVAALRAAGTESGVQVFPVIDGCYLMAERRANLERALEQMMLALAATFIHELSDDLRFLVRGGIAAGRIIEGNAMAKCSGELESHPKYRDCLSIGTAIGQAYTAESKAPPFGFWVDITARSSILGENQPYTEAYWRWWRATPANLGRERAAALGGQLMTYFDWAQKHRRELEYDESRLTEHRESAREYFMLSD